MTGAGGYEGNAGIITAVQPNGKKKHRYDIAVNGEHAITVHEDIVVKHRLVKGRTVTMEELKQAASDDVREESYRKTVRWLGARPRTEAEIRAYLHRNGCERTVQDDIVSRLKECGAVDDERFSQIWAEERLQFQRKGTRLIKRELLGKGIDRRIVSQTLENVDPEAEHEAAAALARKRWPQLAASGDRAAALRKLYAYLARRGFTHAAIRAAMREAADGEGAGRSSGGAVWEEFGDADDGEEG